MDWRVLFSTFIAVFIAELGDKTQLATFSMAAGASSRWPVFIGSALALILTSAIAVAAGGLIGNYVSPTTMKRAAGFIFIVLGVAYLYSSFQQTSV